MELANFGLSVVIPVYNKEANIAPLVEQLILVLASMTDDWGIIFVNDGSHDSTRTVLEGFARIERRIKVIEFRRDYGHTAALAAGIRWGK
ncbi:MAG: glycosyltransferase [Thermoguttaceae bacterium]|nr:glycosyltransferase [Thermoguttaceae bacterium]